MAIALTRVRSVFLFGLLLFAVQGLAIDASARGQAPDKSDNLEVVAQFPYRGGDEIFVGSDVDFSGRYVYGGHTGRRGGVHIFDVGGSKPREVGFLPCPGTQNDVAVVRPGIVALGYHNSACGRVKSGIQLLDVRDPRRVRLLGAVDIPGGTHTLTVYPGKAIIYASPGGAEVPKVETIIDASNPKHPKVLATFDPGPRVGCHDVAFHFSADGRLAFCAGQNATQVWDVSSPTKPKIVSEIMNPAIHFHHSVAATPDGRYLVIGDEAFGTAGGACNTPVNHPTGAVWIYDIADPASPTLVSFFGLNREPPLALCTAHNFNFIPGTRLLVSSWYVGGMNVVDLSDPSEPKEIAHFRAENSDYWSAYWYDGRIYASGRAGLDVLEISSLSEGSG